MDPDQQHAPGDGGATGEGLGAGGARSMEGEDRAPIQLGRELGGDLPCVVCGYNLRGLSIRSVCPECGAGVRATILSVVDPQANVLRPIRFPRLVAGGLLLWSIASLMTALVCWAPHVGEVVSRIGAGVRLPELSSAVVALVVMAAIGAAAIVRPHSGIPPWFTVGSVLGVLLHAPLAWSLVRLQRAGWEPTQAGMRLVLIAMACVAGIFLCMRPTVRLLVARSLLLRSGKVDRQTLYGMAAAALVLALGHAVLWASIELFVGGQVVMRVLGLVLTLTGAALLTLGLVGSVIDCARIAHAIIRPRMTVRDVVRRGVGPSEASRPS